MSQQSCRAGGEALAAVLKARNKLVELASRANSLKRKRMQVQIDEQEVLAKIEVAKADYYTQQQVLRPKDRAALNEMREAQQWKDWEDSGKCSSDDDLQEKWLVAMRRT